MSETKERAKLEELENLIPLDLPDEIKIGLQNCQKELESLKEVNEEQIAENAEILQSDNVVQKYTALVIIRKFISQTNQPSPVEEQIQLLVNLQIPNILLKIIQDNTIPLLTKEATWIIANICSGSKEQISIIVQGNGIKLLSELLKSPYVQVVEQAIWALANIAGDNFELRDLILREDVMIRLQQFYYDPKYDTKKQIISWAVSNLCKGKPKPQFNYIKQSFGILKDIVIESTHQETLSDVCWAISYLSESYSEKFIESNFLKKVISLLDHNSKTVSIPCIRIIGNIATGDDNQTNKLIELEFLAKVPKLLNLSNTSMCKEVCWTLSNITAGTDLQVKHIIFNEQIFFKLLNLINEADYQIKKEIFWVLSNATIHKNQEVINYFLEQNILQLFIDDICEKTNDENIQNLLLEAILNIEYTIFRSQDISMKQLLNDQHQKYQIIEKITQLNETSKKEKVVNLCNQIIELQQQ